MIEAFVRSPESNPNVQGQGLDDGGGDSPAAGGVVVDARVRTPFLCCVSESAAELAAGCKDQEVIRASSPVQWASVGG